MLQPDSRPDRSIVVKIFKYKVINERYLSLYKCSSDIFNQWRSQYLRSIIVNRSCCVRCIYRYVIARYLFIARNSGSPALFSLLLLLILGEASSAAPRPRIMRQRIFIYLCVYSYYSVFMRAGKGRPKCKAIGTRVMALSLDRLYVQHGMADVSLSGGTRRDGRSSRGYPRPEDRV